MKRPLQLSFILIWTLIACSGSSNGPVFPKLEQVWSYPTSQTSYGEVRLVGFNDSMLFGIALDTRAVNTRFLAFDLSNRAVKWVAADPLQASNPTGDWPLAMDDKRSRLVQLNAETGEFGKIFNYPDKFEGVTRGPLTRGGLTFFQNGYPNFYAISGLNSATEDTPKLAWRKEYTYIKAFTASKEGQVFISSDEGYLDPKAKIHSFDVQGNALWTLDLTQGKPVDLGGEPKQRVFSTSIQGRTLVVSTDGGKLQAYDTQTGQPLWERWPSFNTCPTGGAPFAKSLLIAEGKIFVSPNGGICFNAFDLGTGEPLWQFVSLNRVTFGTRPFYKNGVVYAFNSYLWALEAETGKILAVSDKINNGVSDVFYHPQRNELYVWGETLNAYRPLR